MLRIGTSGFSYRDWVGPFYPPGTSSKAMLAYYAGQFPVVEVNSTYYRVPPPRTFQSLAERTPDDFRFTVKLPGSATHPKKGAKAGETRELDAFRAALEPLVSAGKLICCLAQFPTAFRRSPEAAAHLLRLRAELGDLQLVAEFRHREWQEQEALDALEDLGVGFCNVDEPQFASLPRPSAVVTSAVAYVRFHGRNYQTWWKGDNVTRYAYLYSREELAPWVPRVRDVASAARETVVAFNNHSVGNAPRNAREFAELLGVR